MSINQSSIFTFGEFNGYFTIVPCNGTSLYPFFSTGAAVYNNVRTLSMYVFIPYNFANSAVSIVINFLIVSIRTMLNLCSTSTIMPKFVRTGIVVQRYGISAFRNTSLSLGLFNSTGCMGTLDIPRIGQSTMSFSTFSYAYYSTKQELTRILRPAVTVALRQPVPENAAKGFYSYYNEQSEKRVMLHKMVENQIANGLPATPEFINEVLQFVEMPMGLGVITQDLLNVFASIVPVTFTFPFSSAQYAKLRETVGPAGSHTKEYNGIYHFRQTVAPYDHGVGQSVNLRARASMYMSHQNNTAIAA